MYPHYCHILFKKEKIFINKQFTMRYSFIKCQIFISHEFKYPLRT